jgi:hypothetical protein
MTAVGVGALTDGKRGVPRGFDRKARSSLPAESAREQWRATGPRSVFYFYIFPVVIGMRVIHSAGRARPCREAGLDTENRRTNMKNTDGVNVARSIG